MSAVVLSPARSSLFLASVFLACTSVALAQDPAPAPAPSEVPVDPPVASVETQVQPPIDAPVNADVSTPAPTIEASAEPPSVPTAAAPPAAMETPAAQAATVKPATEDHPVAYDKEGFVPGKGLRIESADGLFSLELRLRAQFLFQAVQPYDVEAGKYADAEQGMQIRRARIQFGGRMWGKKTSYKVELAISPGDLGMKGGDNPPITNGDHVVTRSLLLDWYLQFGQLRDLNVRVGQYKVPFSRDRVISSGNLQFVDRTILNNEFNIDRDIGFDLRSTDLFGLDKKLRYYLALCNGEGHSAYGLDDFGMMYLGRIEVLPLGDFDDYSQSDLDRVQGPKLSLGVAYARIQHAKGSRGILGSRFADGGTTDYDNLTADLTFKMRGFSVEAAYFLRDGKRNAGDAVDDEGAPIPTVAARNGWGAGAQAGYLLPNTNFEVGARYSAIRAASKNTSLSDSDEAGIVLNYFFAQHPYKLQADYLRNWGEGARDAGPTLAKGSNQVRLQLQASF